MEHSWQCLPGDASIDAIDAMNPLAGHRHCPQLPLKEEASIGLSIMGPTFLSVNFPTLNKSIHFSGPQIPSTVKREAKRRATALE